MKTQNKLTYTQIAREAGVSEATVSRVLNGDVRVDPERARRVHETVAKLGYKKNRAASALATGRTGLIAVIIDDDLSIFADPFWATVTSGVSRVLMENNMQTLLLVGASNHSDGNFSNYLDSGAVDGACTVAATGGADRGSPAAFICKIFSSGKFRRVAPWRESTKTLVTLV
jgi:DNA-binding LacI/PurR family transcriptional regulator